MMERLRMFRTANRRLRGVTLIEAVLYIAIALALIIGGLVFFQQTSLAARTNDVARLLSSYTTELRALVSQARNVSWTQGGVERVLITSGAVPTTAIDMSQPEGRRIRHGWDSFLDATSTIPPPGSGVRFMRVRIFDIPVGACARLSTSNAAGELIWGTDLRSARVFDDTGGSATSIFPGDGFAQAAAVCRNRDLNGNGKIQVWYDLFVRD